MSSVKSASELLAARDARQRLLDRALAAGRPALLFVSLNLPGPDKSPPGARLLFRCSCERIAESFPGSLLLARERDALGHYALRVLDVDALAAKRLCVDIEHSNPAARLLDLDVYSPSRGQVGRAALGLPPRPCLLCGQPAVDCMRNKRHPLTSVIAQAHALLTRPAP